MTTGMVRELGAGEQAEAANSPIDTVKANTAAEAIALPSTGRSTARQERTGPAPRAAAASRSRGSRLAIGPREAAA